MDAPCVRIYGFQSLTGLGDLLLKNPIKEPQIVLAPLNELKELQAFLSFKSLACFKLPGLKEPPFGARENLLTRNAFKTGALRTLPGIFCAAPAEILKKTIFESPIVLKKGSPVPDLKTLSFQEKEFALKPGEFAVRGYILDIFPPSYESALRLDLTGRDILSIHSLDKDFKTRKQEVKEVTLLSLKEWDLSHRSLLCRFLKNKGPWREELKLLARGEVPEGWEDLMNVLSRNCFLDYFSRAKIWIKDPEELQALFHQNSLLACRKLSPALCREDLFLPWKRFEKFPRLILHSHLKKTKTDDDENVSSIQAKQWPTVYPCYSFKSEGLKKDLQSLPIKDIVFISRNREEENKLKNQIQNLSPLKNKNLLFLKGRLISSFVNEGADTAYIQTRDLKGGEKILTSGEKSGFQSFWRQARALDFSRLKAGELLVHRKHGVGQFVGLENLSFQGVGGDYLILSYRKGDKLLLPAYKAMEIKKYALGPVPFKQELLDRLGDPRKWEKKKEQAKKHIQAVAVELLSLYRARKNLIRPPFKPASDSLKKFEKTFPFKETPGQVQSLKEIFKDMSGTNPMDRLLCADVGFGKTEVALRTAFRALENGFQVCFLVPTTILSLQHYENFNKRLRDRPFKSAALNRFLKPSEKRTLLKGIQNGSIHFIIATHSIFSPQVRFKNLGLLIIDEEHRFGVRQKEHLRRLKKQLDTLSLSATPIPRTLSMALSGMKDISVIPHPPAKRKPIETRTAQWNPSLIRQACEREKNRAGQILFVHNKIQSIKTRLEELKGILPDFKIALCHGRMKSLEMEKVMLAFFEKKFDLLLSTSIMESGMDIRNANTLFIDQAHEMGLSRIYQLKGRVGRGERQAFCYFLVPKKISPASQKRLELLEKYSDLGAGFHLAMHDLERRGAGEIFGAEQSGHLNNLGQELFFELLNEKLQNSGPDMQPDIQLPVSTGIPASYIQDKPLRLLYYKSLSESKSRNELICLKEEMEKAHGILPPEVNHLFRLLQIRLLCKTLLIKNLKAGKTKLFLDFHEDTPVKKETILLGLEENLWSLRGEFSIQAPLDNSRDMFSQIDKILKRFHPPE